MTMEDHVLAGGFGSAVLEALLDKYADEGIEHIETMNVLRVQPLSTFGTPVEIVRLFGGKEQYEQAVRDLFRIDLIATVFDLGL